MIFVNLFWPVRWFSKQKARFPKAASPNSFFLVKETHWKFVKLFVSKRAEKVAMHVCAQSGMQSIVPWRQNRAKCSYRPLQRTKCSYRPLQRAKCSYRTKLDCPRLTTHSHETRLFPPIWTQNVVCTDKLIKFGGLTSTINISRSTGRFRKILNTFLCSTFIIIQLEKGE